MNPKAEPWAANQTIRGLGLWIGAERLRSSSGADQFVLVTARIGDSGGRVIARAIATMEIAVDLEAIGAAITDLIVCANHANAAPAQAEKAEQTAVEA